MSIISGILGADATRDAASSAEQGQQAGIDTEWKMYEQQRADWAPWREAGLKALDPLTEMTLAGPGEFKPEEQPGYEFGFKNFIEKPYLSGQSAKGKRLSGETMKGLTQFASGYAETSYDNFLNRYYQKLRPYQSLAGIGQTALNATSQSGQQTANAVANMQGTAGAYQGQGQMAGAQGFQNISGGMQRGYNNYLAYKYLQGGGAAQGATAAAATNIGVGAEASEFIM